jgi:hypothetical protein
MIISSEHRGVSSEHILPTKFQPSSAAHYPLPTCPEPVCGEPVESVEGLLTTSSPASRTTAWISQILFWVLPMEYFAMAGYNKCVADPAGMLNSMKNPVRNPGGYPKTLLRHPVEGAAPSGPLAATARRPPSSDGSRIASCLTTAQARRRLLRRAAFLPRGSADGIRMIASDQRAFPPVFTG